jgi:hypothetical protein
MSTSPLIAVYDGSKICIGHLYRHGKDDIQAFDSDTVSLGTYSSIDDAAVAVWRHAHAQRVEGLANGRVA